MPASPIVIVHGPQGCGKSHHAQQLLAHYGCTRVVDEWAGDSPLEAGDLALTHLTPSELIEQRLLPKEPHRLAAFGFIANELGLL